MVVDNSDKRRIEKMSGGLYVKAINEVHQNEFDMKSVQFDGHKLGNVLEQLTKWIRENDVFIHDISVNVQEVGWIASVYYR